MLNENDLNKTSDLSLVATLLCFGGKIQSVDRGSGPRAVFYLQQEKGLEQLVRAYWAHELRVDPAAYFAALKEAKTRLYEQTINY